MAHTRVALEIGMGTALQSQDYTKAAIRAVSDALWHNSLTMALAFGFPKEAMIINVDVATQAPEKVDCDAVAAVFPYGQVSVRSVKGGLDMPKPPRADGGDGGVTVMANAAVVVSFDMEKGGGIMKRLILEMGTGNDLYGQDYTKAACRAVQDAIHHSSLILFRSLGLDHAHMQVNVTIAVQHPEAVDADIVRAELPRGNANVTVVFGGLDVHDEAAGTVSVIANAAIEACYDIADGDWVLSS